MAIVYHNTDDNYRWVEKAIHAVMPSTSKSYIATKYVLSTPPPYGRSAVLPWVMGWLGGPVTQLHDWMLDHFGLETGSDYFDKFIMIVPVLVLLAIGQLVASQLDGGSKTKKKAKKTKKQ
mmetsp:Transcript_38665/g.54435  ORF Transcript_38665/g.54435 Transcript_38665/m.54435 type:complete len:120 (+) Transcript_38665:975-1334(+)